MIIFPFKLWNKIVYIFLGGWGGGLKLIFYKKLLHNNSCSSFRTVIKYMIFQINENCVEFKAPMKRKLCLKVPELISIKKEIYAVFTVFMIILSMLRKEEQLYHKNIIVTRR